MVAFGAAHHPLARYHRYCCQVRRHDELRYRMPHEELLKKYRSCLNAAPRLPEVLAKWVTSCTLPALRTKPPCRRSAAMPRGSPARITTGKNGADKSDKIEHLVNFIRTNCNIL